MRTERLPAYVLMILALCTAMLHGMYMSEHNGLECATIECDYFGIYFDNCYLRYGTEVHNPYNVPMYCGDFKSNSGSRIAHLWRTPSGGVVVPPHRSVLVGLLDASVKSPPYGCDLATFFIRSPERYIWLSGIIDTVHPAERGYRSTTGITNHTRYTAKDIRNHALVGKRLDSIFGRGRAPQIAAALDSIAIAPDLFEYVIGKGTRYGGRHFIAGLVKVKNLSRSDVLLDTATADDGFTRVVGLPEWMSDDRWTGPLWIPPGEAIVLEYECRVIPAKFNGDVDAFLAAGHSFELVLRFRNAPERALRATVRLLKENLRRTIRLPGASYGSNGYQISD